MMQQNTEVLETGITEQRRRIRRALIRSAHENDRLVLEHVDLNQSTRKLADRQVQRFGDVTVQHAVRKIEGE